MRANLPKIQQHIPVTVIGGFLGAGKTSLVQHLMATGNKRFGIIVNEFGSLGIDGTLVETLSDGGVAELQNGCLCCLGREDLLQALVQLTLQPHPPEHVLIELSGVADPVPVAQTLLDPYVKGLFTLAGLIGVADAKHLSETLQSSPEGAVQLAYAQHIILNKVDLISTQILEDAQRLLTGLNPLATVHVARHGAAHAAALLAPVAFSSATAGLSGLNSAHTPGLQTFVLRADAPLDRQRWQNFVARFITADPAHVLRAKGFLRIAGLEPTFLFQAVRDIVNLDALPADATLKRDPQRSELVIIGRELDKSAYERAFSALVKKRLWQRFWE